MAAPTETGLTAMKAEIAKLEANINVASSRERALELSIQAAETCMRALKLASDKQEKSALSVKCKSLLRRAEDIKLLPNWDETSGASTSRTSFDPPGSIPASRTAQTSPAKRLTEPVSKRPQSKTEQITVLRASKLNGSTFPPWKDAPNLKDFELVEETPFEDSTYFCLSEQQLQLLAGWHRPQQALPPPAWPNERSETTGPTMHTNHKVDLVQDAATDCSVVASLCSGTARGERGHHKLLSRLMYPYDYDQNQPGMSANGKYILRFHFNGCYRRVTIDDRLPVSTSKHMLHVLDRSNPALLWPALVEKAYLKIRGGYGFPGSNPSTDLWIIVGWIPEHVFMQDDGLDPDTLWKRLLKAHRFGDVLVNLGTGVMSRRVERSIGLASQHAYAVLDLKEEDDQRLLLVKNPWSEGESWKGYGSDSSDAWSSPTPNTTVTNVSISENPTGGSVTPSFPRPEQQLTPGTFWIDLNKVLQHFESIYLNWNPGLFASREDIHFSWDLSTAAKRGSPGCCANHPQISVSIKESGVLWLLLSRHFKNTTIDADDETDTKPPPIDLDGHIGISVYDSNGERVYVCDGAMERGPFVDTPQTLLRLNVSAGITYTVAIAEQELSSTVHSFTLSAFAQSPIILEEAADRHTYSQSANSSWTPATAGGNATSHTYPRNPQFSINVAQTTPITLLLETLAPNLNVHVNLVHSSGGKRINTLLKRRDILGDSGHYRKQSCIAEVKTVEPGTYTIIASTFEPNQCAWFSLRAYSNTPVSLRLLPNENAGRLPVQLKPARFPDSSSTIACPLRPRKTARVFIEARFVQPPQPHGSGPGSTASSPLKLVIEHGRRYERRAIALSHGGEFTESAASIRTEDVDLWPDMLKQGELWLVLERLIGGSGASDEQYALTMWFEGITDPDDAVEVGSWREWERD